MSEVTIVSNHDEVKPLRLEASTRSVRTLDVVDRAVVGIHEGGYRYAGVFVDYGIRLPRYDKLIWGVRVEDSNRVVWTTSDKLLKPAKFGHAALIQDRMVVQVGVSRSAWRQAWSWAVEDAGIDLVREDWVRATSRFSTGKGWAKDPNGRWRHT